MAAISTTNILSKNINKKVIFKTKEHDRIYSAFYSILQTKNIENFYTFENGKNLINANNFKGTDQLSEENFVELLLSIFSKVYKKDLNSNEIVIKCVNDARNKEAKDCLIKLIGKPFGIAIEPKNILGSIKTGLMNKISFLGGKKEEKEQAKSDTQVVINTLYKLFIPVALFVLFSNMTTSLVLFGMNIGPLILMISIVGLIMTQYKIIKGLFDDVQKETVYHPESDEIEPKNWEEEIEKRLDEKISHSKLLEHEKVSEKLSDVTMQNVFDEKLKTLA
ncbi:MAG: hypothetical protein KTV77_00480 [Wolbachia endosymbiont of Fragariocoptes setiger]|nr:hypothetical protein [Wolbachia endosymbiont of Fragariocoptes setiger]